MNVFSVAEKASFKSHTNHETQCCLSHMPCSSLLWAVTVHTRTHTHTRLSSHYTALQFTCFSKLIMTCQYIYNIWMLRQCGCDFHTNSLLPFTTGTKQQGRRVREGESEREKHVWKEFYHTYTWSNCTHVLATTPFLLLVLWWICTTHKDALRPQVGCIHSTIASEGMVNIFIFICQVSETDKNAV